MRDAVEKLCRGRRHELGLDRSTVRRYAGGADSKPPTPHTGSEPGPDGLTRVENVFWLSGHDSGAESVSVGPDTGMKPIRGHASETRA